MSDFLRDLFTSKEVWGSIIGGLVGGLFTYLAVILTFKYQRRNEYPAKIISLTKMISDINSFRDRLTWYLIHYEVPEEEQEDVERKYVEAVDFKIWKETLLLDAVTVDKHIYKSVLIAFRGLSDGFGIYTVLAEKEVEQLRLYQEELSKLRETMEKRVNYYFRRIQ